MGSWFHAFPARYVITVNNIPRFYLFINCNVVKDFWGGKKKEQKNKQQQQQQQEQQQQQKTTEQNKNKLTKSLVLNVVEISKNFLVFNSS